MLTAAAAALAQRETAVPPDGRRVFVANGSINTVSVIDTATNSVVEVLPAGNHPFGVAIKPPSPGFSFETFSAELEVHLAREIPSEAKQSRIKAESRLLRSDAPRKDSYLWAAVIKGFCQEASRSSCASSRLTLTS